VEGHREQIRRPAILSGLRQRTGLTPAGDDELTNTKNTMNYVTVSPPVLLGARKKLSVSCSKGFLQEVIASSRRSPRVGIPGNATWRIAANQEMNGRNGRCDDVIAH